VVPVINIVFIIIILDSGEQYSEWHTAFGIRYKIVKSGAFRHVQELKEPVGRPG